MGSPAAEAIFSSLVASRESPLYQVIQTETEGCNTVGELIPGSPHSLQSRVLLGATLGLQTAFEIDTKTSSPGDFGYCGAGQGKTNAVISFLLNVGDSTFSLTHLGGNVIPADARRDKGAHAVEGPTFCCRDLFCYQLG